MTFERIVQRGPITIDLIPGPGSDLVVSFSSIGHDAGRAPSPEFVGTATGRGTSRRRRALFVMDESRSWANTPDFGPALQEAVAKVTAAAPVGRLGTIGLSMGAFSALVAAQLLPVDVVLAFGPQFTFATGRKPDESRWRDWTARLPPVQWPTAPLPERGWACLFHGLIDDRAQAMAFPLQKGTDHLLFESFAHSDLVPHLKAKGSLAGLLEAALDGDRRRLLRIASAAGGIRRRSDSLSPGPAPKAGPSSP